MILKVGIIKLRNMNHEWFAIILPETLRDVLSIRFSTIHIPFDVHKCSSKSLRHQGIQDWIENTIEVVEDPLKKEKND